MKKCAFVFTALLLAVSLFFTGGGSPQPLSRVSGSGASSCLSVNTDLTNKTEGNVHIQTAVPQFAGFDGAKLLNSNICDVVNNGIKEVNRAEKDLEDNHYRPSIPLYFSSTFDYSENAGVLSTWISNENYTGGAHGFHWIQSFTVNMKTGETYDTIGSLFVDAEAGKKLITDKIISEIKKEPDRYLPNASEAEKTVKDKNGDFHFYLDGNNLIVYFDLYDITCYAAGIPVFKFPLADLKTKIPFGSMSPGGNIRKNGMSLDFNNQVISNEKGTFLPLEETDGALSHRVLNKNGIYTIDGKAIQPTMINGIAFMPLDFFTEKLGDFIIYDGEVLRMFTQTAAAAQDISLSSGTADEKPIQTQMAYIKSFDEKSETVVFDPVEWISQADTVRLKELNINPENVNNDYYIYNPSEQTESRKLSDQAKVYLIDPNSRAKGGIEDFWTDKARFAQRLKEDGALTYPYRIQIKDGEIIQLYEQYVP